mgnify:CR=1 FL=1
MPEHETDEQLLDRYQRVQKKFNEAHRKMERLPLGPSRSKAAQWAGCINFTLLGIESELRDRGLKT